MMPFPMELVTSFARGSIRHCPPTMKVYCCPTLAPGRSTDQWPFPSAASGVAVALHALNSPATKTEGAKGAQTRKVTPPEYAMAPRPGRDEGWGTVRPRQRERSDVRKGAPRCQSRERRRGAPSVSGYLGQAGARTGYNNRPNYLH